MRAPNLAAVLSACITLSQAIQPGAAPAEQAPLRDLEFGDLNFLHTTDTHGWHSGHLLEPSFSADWGDYISFTKHLREKLEADGKDLLIIDTGDRIEGNGLYDASDPRGQYTFGIFSQQHIDLLCSGNHELYKNSSAEDDYTKLVPVYKDNYLASNLEIIDPKTGQLELLAPRFRTFTTTNGVRIMAFGFVFDFTRNDKNTVVIPVEQAVKYPWFQTAIATADIDLFVVIGHVALRSQEFEVIHQAIRSVKPDIPIQFFGGHYHIRDYRIFDNKAHALASGRFMETIGFLSIVNLNSDNITFARRYIDNNLHSLYHHSNKTVATFPTKAGLNTTAMITFARTALDLDQTFGCAPQPYWMSRTPYTANDSIFNLITDHVFPSIINLDRANRTRVMITNTGGIRFDIFAGPFTRDSMYIVSPFTSNLSYIPDIPYKLAKRILPILNGQDPQTIDVLGMTTVNKRWKFHVNDLAPPEQQARNAAWSYWTQKGKEHDQQNELEPQDDIAWRKVLEAQATAEDPDDLAYTEFLLSSIDRQHSKLTQNKEPPLHRFPQSSHFLNNLSPNPDSYTYSKEHLTPGYTTHDDLGSSGDDTLHSPIQFYDVPNCVQTIIPGPDSSIPPNDATQVTSQGNVNDDSATSGPACLASTSNTRTVEADVNANEEVVDLVFNEFLMPYILTILNILPYYTCDGPFMIEDNEDFAAGAMWSMTPPAAVPECVTLGLCEDRLPPQWVRDRHDNLVNTRRYFDAMNRGVDAEEIRVNGVQLSRKIARHSLRKYVEDDVSNYIPGETFTTLLAGWVRKNWAKNCGDRDRKEMNGEL